MNARIPEIYGLLPCWRLIQCSRARSVDNSPVYRGGVPVKTHAHTRYRAQSLLLFLPPSCLASSPVWQQPGRGDGTSTGHDALRHGENSSSSSSSPSSSSSRRFRCLFSSSSSSLLLQGAAAASSPLHRRCWCSFTRAQAGSLTWAKEGRQGRQAGKRVGRPRMPVNTRSTLPGF